jgi:hypothetical protein
MKNIKEGLQHLLNCKACLMCKHYLRPCSVTFYNKDELHSTVKADVSICNKLGVIEPFDKTGFYFSKQATIPRDFTACKGVNFEKGGANYEYLEELEFLETK